MEELSEKFKTGEINEKQLKEAVRELAKGYGKDIGIDFEVVYLDEKTMPKASEGSTGSAYIVDKKNRKVLIPIDVSKIGDINELLGTLTEEIRERLGGSVFGLSVMLFYDILKIESMKNNQNILSEEEINKKLHEIYFSNEKENNGY